MNMKKEKHGAWSFSKKRLYHITYLTSCDVNPFHCLFLLRTSRNFNRMISLKISRSSCSPNRATVCNKRHPRCVVSHECQRKDNKEAGGLSCLHSNSAWLP